MNNQNKVKEIKGIKESIASIDMGGTNTKMGVVLNGEVLAECSITAKPASGIKSHLDEILEKLRTLYSDLGGQLEDCRGMALLSTGIVNSRKMRVLSTNQKYDDAVSFNFLSWAKESCGLELKMENDARGALLGECRSGGGKGCQNVVMMAIGTGIGCAVLLDGKPFVGAHYTGGILGGHIQIKSGGRRCSCGSRGCLEAETGGWALPGILKDDPEFSTSSLSDAVKLDYKTLFFHASKGDSFALRHRDRLIQLWAEAVISYIHLFDPEKIIMGGGVMNEPELILKRVRQAVKEGAWMASPNQVEILSAKNPNYAGLIGAAELYDL